MLDPQEKIAGRYEIVRRIGQGAMGAVYLATDLSEQCDVAIKVLTLPPDDHKARFQREFRLMSQLRHPHVIKVFDNGEHDDLPFLVMAYVAGGTLVEHYPEPPANLADVRERLELSCQICNALAYIHSQGVIHQDITPSNIMLEGSHCFVMDFGLAKPQSVSSNFLTHIGDVMGTAAYMSPEQIQGQPLDSRSDLYALGCVLYWLFTGRAPFTGTALTTLINAHVHQVPDAPSSHNPYLSTELDAILLKLLSKAASTRYSSANYVLDDLRTLVDAHAYGPDSLNTQEPSPDLTLSTSHVPTPSEVDTVKLESSDVAASKSSSSVYPNQGSVYPNQGVDSPSEVSAPVTLAPSPRQRLLHAPLLGRTPVWNVLAGELAAFPEQGQLVVIDNPEPGFGATRLLREVYQRSRNRNLTNVIVRHDEHRLLNAWPKPLRCYAQQVDPEGAYLRLEPRLQALLAGQQGQLADVSAGSLNLLPTRAPSQLSLQQELFDTVSQLFAKHPCVLLIDNIDSADEASCQLLCHLLEADVLQASLVIIAGRCNQVGEPLGRFLKHTRQEQRAGTLQDTQDTVKASGRSSYLILQPLANNTMRQLLEARFGAPLETSLAEHLCHHAAGSPRLAEDLLRTLLSGDKLSKHNGQWTWNTGTSYLPTSAHDVLQERLRQLPNRTQATLRAASTLGTRFDFASLQDLYLYDVLQQAQVNQVGVPELPSSQAQHAQLQHSEPQQLSQRVLADSVPSAVDETAVDKVSVGPSSVYDDANNNVHQANTSTRTITQAHLNTRSLSRTLRNALLDDLTVLVQADLIRETSSSYRFVQPQVQQMLHADLEPHRKRRYHEHLAEVLSRRGNTSPEVLAWHYAEAKLPYHAAAHALASARRAEALFANSQSETHYRLALKLLPATSLKALQTKLALARVLERTGKWQEATQYYQQVLASRLKPQALHALGRLEQTRGNLVSSERYLRQALRLSDNAQMINSDLGRTLTLKGEFDAAKKVLIRNLRAAEDAIRASSEDDSARTPEQVSEQARAVAQAHVDLAELAIHCGDKASAQASLTLAQRCPPQYQRLHAKVYNLLGVTCRLLEQLDDAETHYQQAEALYEDIGDLERSLSVQLNRANLLADRGERAAAFQADASVAARAKRIGDKKHEAMAIANQGEELLAQGKFEAALTKLQQASKLFNRLNYSQYYNHVQLNVQLTYIRQGRFEDAHIGLDSLHLHVQQTAQPQQRAHFELVLAECWLWQHQADLAVDILEEATRTLHLMHDVREAIDGYILLAQAYAFDSPSDISACLTQAAKLAEGVLDPLYSHQVAYVQAYLQGDSTRAQGIKVWLEQHGYGHFARRVRKLLASKAND